MFFKLIPGNQPRLVAFYPEAAMAYDAQVFVEVDYDNTELFRWTYRTRPLPTFVVGGVNDQLQQNAVGIEVRIDGLARTAITNDDGGFTFGFNDPAAARIPDGRYRMVLNPGLANPNYGTVIKWVTIQEGRRNDIGLHRVLLLNKKVGFRLVESGNNNVVLAGGDVVLDLSDAGLIFPDSRTSGSVHVQFNSVEQIVLDTTPHAIPHWMYSLQPFGITVEGKVGIDLALPSLFGQTDYVPTEAPYVLLMGVDDGSNLVTPIGVGKVADGRVRSARPVALTRLDYLGIAFVLPEQQSVLEAYANDELTFQQLLAALQQEQ